MKTTLKKSLDNVIEYKNWVGISNPVTSSNVDAALPNILLEISDIRRTLSMLIVIIYSLTHMV